MTRPLHEPANALLYRALDLPPADRQQFIADACAGEPELLALVRELLARIEQLDEFLEAPLDVVEVRTDARPSGAGVAPLADTASAADASPFFATDRGDGVPIDRHCAAARLDLKQRVALFAKACRAMHHAHQHLHLHRDLKPDNILVHPDGGVTLADAGDATSWTVAPLFASPEQLAGLPLTTSSDIYSLGAILYGLLSGRSPNAAEAAGIIPAKGRPALVRASDAVAQAAERHYPPLPELAADDLLKPDAKLAAQLRGDIDAILMKALDPEPARRYASADALAVDLERFVANEPVEAAPAGVERRRAQPRRGRFGSALIGTAALALVALTGASVLHALESDKARVAAEHLVAIALSDEVRHLPPDAPLAPTVAAPAEPQDSLTALRKELAMREMIAAKDAGSAPDALGVADAHTAIGNALVAAMDYPAAEAEYAAARKTYAAQMEASPADAALKAGLIEIDLARAHVQNLQRHGRDAVQTLAGLHKLEGGTRDARITLIEAHIQPRGTAAQAFAAAEPALAELLTQYEADPKDVARLRKSAQAWQSAAEVALRANQTAAACRYLGLAAKRYDEFAASNSLIAIDKLRQSQVQELRKSCG